MRQLIRRDPAPQDSGGSPGSQPIPDWLPPFLGLILSAGLALRLWHWSKPIADLFEPYFLTDDGYYAFSYARELARGHPYQSAPGFTGNGFQPLHVLLIAPFFWISPENPDLPVRLALLLSIGFSMGTCALLCVWAARLWGIAAGAVAAGIWALSPTAIIHSLNGLETALHLFCICLLGAFWPWFLARPFRLGLMLGLTVLARVDTALAVPILLAVAFVQQRSLPARAEPGAGKRAWLDRPGFLSIARALAGLALVIAPYNLSSWAYTGYLTPMSGRGMRNLSLYFAFAEPDSFLPGRLIFQNLSAARRALKAEISLHLFHDEVWVNRAQFPLLLWSAYAVLGICLALLVRPWRLARGGAFALGAGIAGLWLAAYTCYVGGSWFYPRYFHPGLLLLTLGIAGLASTIRLPRIRAARAAPFLFLVFSAALSSRVLDHKAEAGRFYFNLDWLPRIRKLAESGRVGMYQSGVIAYYTDGAVLNLDGVANREALDALAERKLDGYLEEQKITRVVDWDWIEPALFRRRSDPNRTYMKLLGRTSFFWTWEPAALPNPDRIAALRNSIPSGLVLLPNDAEFHPRAGWGDPRLDGEDLYCWTVEDDPRVAFKGPPVPGRYTLRLHFDRPFPWPEGSAEVGVLWPGERAVRKIKAGPGPFLLETKIDVARPAAEIMVQLHIPATEPPDADPERSFDRRLGARFFRLEVIPEAIEGKPPE